MNRNLKVPFILILSFFGVVIAMKTASNFFHGVGIPFVLLLGLGAVLTYLVVKDKDVRRRVLDMYIISLVFICLEFVTYYAGELVNVASKGLMIYQTIVSALGLLAFIYVVFRWVMERQGKKVEFIECMLGNSKREKKQKTKSNKELNNGSLQDKPKNLAEQSLFADVQEEETSATEEQKTKPASDEESEN